VSDFLIDWAGLDSNSVVLETSCGNGIFLSSICKKFSNINLPKDAFQSHLIGIELVEEEANKARRLLSDLDIANPEKIVLNGDFFDYCQLFLKNNKKFSMITGNPPFIRYQDFPQKSKEIAFKLISELFDFKLSGHANSWIAFLLLSSQLLSENGKIAMVIPAQLFQVKYATDTRRFLSVFFSKLTIITFEKLIFPTAQQEVILLLGERNNGPIEGIRVIELKNENDLYLRIRPEDVSKNFQYYKYKPMDHSTEKWTQYFLDTEEIELLRKIPTLEGIKRGGDLYSVDIGVVTGKNKFFILSKNTLNNIGIDEKYTIKIFGRSSDIEGIIFSEDDWQKIRQKDNPCYLFAPSQTQYADLPDAIKNYIEKGVQHGVNEGFKCRIRRDDWFRVPTIYKPEAFLLRQIHDYPKMVLNTSGSTCTDTIHRVNFNQGVDGKKIAGAFLNSLTFASAEVKGRSYGGGVLTLEPSEAEELLIPIVGIDHLNPVDIDTNIRKGNLAQIFDANDKILLRDGLGMNFEQVRILRNIWVKLRNRRNNRKISPR
jgi:adenine-specific DNA-methyltransferase